jgi:hypothetical protein
VKTDFGCRHCDGRHPIPTEPHPFVLCTCGDGRSHLVCADPMGAIVHQLDLAVEAARKET